MKRGGEQNVVAKKHGIARNTFGYHVEKKVSVKEQVIQIKEKIKIMEQQQRQQQQEEKNEKRKLFFLSS